MRSVVRTHHAMALALLVAATGCAVGDGTGLLVLTITSDGSVPAGAASRIVLVFPGTPDRTYAGAFPLGNGAPLVLQFPNLPASSSQVNITVRALDPAGCPIAEATKPVTVQGGAKTTADVVLAKASGSCAGDGGADGAVDGQVDSRWDGETRPVDVLEANRAEAQDGVGPDGGTDVSITTDGQIGTGGAGGAAVGGTTGAGGVATGGATGSGGASGLGATSGAGGKVTGGSTGSGGATNTGKGGAGTGGNGTGGHGTGGSGTGGSGTGGSGTGGSGTGGSGTGGSGTGGSGTGGSGTGGATCQKGLVPAQQVVIMGDSFFSMSPQYIQKRLEARARNAGAIDELDSYRNVATNGQPMSYVANNEWDAATQNATVTVVIMNGGGLDCMTSDCPTCPGTFQGLLAKMATAGVQDVIYARYPEPGNPPGSNTTLKGNYDILMPKLQTVCEQAANLRCHWVDLRPVWLNGDTSDGLHPTESGGNHAGDAIWAEMVKDCIAQ